MTKKLNLISLLEMVTAGVTGSNETDRLSNLPLVVELPDGATFWLADTVTVKDKEIVIQADFNSAFDDFVWPFPEKDEK